MKIYDNLSVSRTQSGSSLLTPLLTTLCFQCNSPIRSTKLQQGYRFNMLVSTNPLDPTRTQREPQCKLIEYGSRWVCEGCVCVGHVNFMLFVPFSCALGSQHKSGFGGIWALLVWPFFVWCTKTNGLCLETSHNTQGRRLGTTPTLCKEGETSLAPRFAT